jgi:AcrR family transcriptional regulator
MARLPNQDARDTRQAILDRSLDLFAEAGFFGTSMRDIARAVGVRQSALYHHFPSKDAILGELLRRLGPGRVDQILALDVGALIDGFGGEGMLRRLVEMILAMWATPEERKIFRLMLTEGPRIQAEGIAEPMSFIRRGREAIGGILQELHRRGFVRELDFVAAAQAFMGPMILLRLTHFSLTAQPPDWTTIRQDAERHLGFFWAAVRAPAPEPAARRRPPRTSNKETNVRSAARARAKGVR